VAKTYTTYQAAKICDIHLTTVVNWMKHGGLKGYATPGGHRRIKKEDLISFMKEKGIPLPEELKKTKKSILIVDDDPEMLEELGEVLSNVDFDFDLASDGFEAGKKVYQNKPDIILLDFKMPGMDGFAVCEILHRDEETQNIPIIAISALKSDDEIRDIKQCGVREYLPKPINIKKLIKSIRSILGCD